MLRWTGPAGSGLEKTDWRLKAEASMGHAGWRFRPIIVAMMVVGAVVGQADAAYRISVTSGGTTDDFYGSGADTFGIPTLSIGGYQFNDLLEDYVSNPGQGTLLFFLGANFTQAGAGPITISGAWVVDNPTLDALDVTGKGVQVTGSNISLLNSLALLAGSTQAGPNGVLGVGVQALPFASGPPLPANLSYASTSNGTTLASNLASLDGQDNSYAALNSGPLYTFSGILTLSGAPSDLPMTTISGFTTIGPASAAAPEPSSLALCSLGGVIALIVAVARRKRGA